MPVVEEVVVAVAQVPVLLQQCWSQYHHLLRLTMMMRLVDSILEPDFDQPLFVVVVAPLLTFLSWK